MELTTDGVPETEYSEQFLQGMINRMGVSFYKYGKIKDAYPHDVSAIKSLQQRIDKYIATGNAEFLMDAANFCMIEFVRPSLPNAFYEATDSDQSPGRTTVRDKVTDASNNDRKLW